MTETVVSIVAGAYLLFVVWFYGWYVWHREGRRLRAEFSIEDVVRSCARAYGFSTDDHTVHRIAFEVRRRAMNGGGIGPSEVMKVMEEMK